jgi:5-methylcytosine-specific restriction enzyme A
MTVYFHHVGEVGAARDFPRTIFDDAAPSGVHRFKGDDILPELAELPEGEIYRVAAAIRGTPHGLQIWGIPSGGSRLFRRVSEGDFWLLIDTDRPGGSISYAGRIVCKVENPSFHLSNFLWGEAKFPLILLLDGFRTNLEITEFKEMFGYAANWSMRGLAYSLRDDRIQNSKFGSEAALIDHLQHLYKSDATNHFQRVEEPPPDEFVIEGGLALTIHLSRERDQTIIAKFKKSLTSFACCVCGFDFGKTYGGLGEHFIEAHHVAPLGKRKERETRVSDLRPVCSNCHRMLHRGLGMSTKDLQSLLKKQVRR